MKGNLHLFPCLIAYPETFYPLFWIVPLIILLKPSIANMKRQREGGLPESSFSEGKFQQFLLWLEFRTVLIQKPSTLTIFHQNPFFKEGWEVTPSWHDHNGFSIARFHMIPGSSPSILESTGSLTKRVASIICLPFMRNCPFMCSNIVLQACTIPISYQSSKQGPRLPFSMHHKATILFLNLMLSISNIQART